MRGRLNFAIILLLFPANCWPKDVHLDSATQTAPKPTSSNWTCASGRCLRKCCQADEIFHVWTGSCEPDLDNRLQRSWSSRYPNFEIIYNSRCPDISIVLNISVASDEYYIFENGSIVALGQLIGYQQYCLDLLAEDDSIMPLVCLEAVRADESAENLLYLLFTVGLSTSIVFLAITLGLYLAAPRLRQKVHDKCFICHVVTLIVGFGWLICIQNVDVRNKACAFFVFLLTYYLNNRKLVSGFGLIGASMYVINNASRFYGYQKGFMMILASTYMCQFWFLASFFWLNIMCIDMRRSVKNVRIIKKSDKRRLLLYCLYAWGWPCLISLCSLSADKFLPQDHLLRTGFGEEGCWFRFNKGNFSWVDPRFVHFYIFIVITILINLYMFVATALIIRTQNKHWEKNKNGESKRHKPDDVRIILYLKLFIVMGLYWIVEVLSYHYGGKSLFWNTLDVLITLQGVFIFIIFICNKRALKILCKRFFPRQAFRKQYIKTLSNQNRSMQRGGI